MSWKIEFDIKAKKELLCLDKQAQNKIIKFLSRIIKHPKSTGKALSGNLSGLWRYRIGDYRIICRIEAGELIVIVIAVGHRKDVYK